MSEKAREGDPAGQQIPEPGAADAETIRRRITAIVDHVLEIEDPLTRLEVLIDRLLGEFEGALELSVALAVDPAPSPDGGGRARDQLESTVRNLMASLVGDAQSVGAIRSGSDLEMADLLYAGLRATLLRWRDDGCPPDLAERGRCLLDLWLHGVVGDGGRAPRLRDHSTLELRVLDVRPLLDRAEDPLQVIRESLHGLASGSLLHITAPFRPTPLEALLADAGHTVDIAQLGDTVWSVAVLVDGTCEVADLRELEPPGPLEAVLLATVTGGPYAARLPRLPRLLAPQLDQRQITWRVAELADGTALIWIAP